MTSMPTRNLEEKESRKKTLQYCIVADPDAFSMVINNLQENESVFQQDEKGNVFVTYYDLTTQGFIQKPISCEQLIAEKINGFNRLDMQYDINCSIFVYGNHSYHWRRARWLDGSTAVRSKRAPSYCV